jgi:hypothetical protein
MNFRKLILFSYTFWCIISISPGIWAKSTISKKLEYADKIYEDHIKTAYLFQADEIQASPLYPVAIPLAQVVPLILKFDDIYTDNADYYKARIVHCNMLWNPSNLSDMQYLFEYNEFSIDEFEFSIATKVPYTHFTFPIPRVKLPGNYLLVIYRENDKDDIILSKRFIVYDHKVKILGNIGLSTGVIQKRMNQQIQFDVDYSSFPIPNPYLDVHVVLKENQRWDNAIYDLTPTSIKEEISLLEYHHFNFENNFKAGNEFRFFDIRSIHYGGRNVERTTTSDTQIDAYLYFDKSRETDPYSLTKDFNGGYIIENSEGRDNELEADYINVHFFLDLKSQINEDIYIGGKLTDWRFDQSNKMNYVDVSGLYMGAILLKQGLYDFAYFIPENLENPNLIEGNHFETRNEYEIIIYFNDRMLNTDVIIGYIKLI